MTVTLRPYRPEDSEIVVAETGADGLTLRVKERAQAATGAE